MHKLLLFEIGDWRAKIMRFFAGIKGKNLNHFIVIIV
jgi:hypothetical protein